MAFDPGTRPALRLPQPGSLGTAGLLLSALVLAAIWGGLYLDLNLFDLNPGRGGLQLAGEFFSRALTPALSFEGLYAGQSGGLLRQALLAAGTTVIYAAAALSLAIVGGLFLGFLGSTAWWAPASDMHRSAALVTPVVRAMAVIMRSIHELVWAVILLAALGRDPLVAVLAIAIPYTGTLAKIFAEMIDEAPRDAAMALAWAGASPWQQFCFGLLPRALPDLLAYTFYRFECALRSSAVLGFFGFPTLGYYIAASFENLLYGEVWTYLYVLLGLILLADAWSGRLRREVVA